MIIRIVDQKSVVDRFLQALGFVTLRDKRTSLSSGGTFFDTGGLGQSFVMGFDVVNDEPPFSVNVNGGNWLNISGFRWAQVGFFNNFLQSVNRVIGIGQNILVHLLD